MKSEKEIKQRKDELEDSLKFVFADMKKNKKANPQLKLTMWRDAIKKILAQIEELEWTLNNK